MRARSDWRNRLIDYVRADADQAMSNLRTIEGRRPSFENDLLAAPVVNGRRFVATEHGGQAVAMREKRGDASKLRVSVDGSATLLIAAALRLPIAATGRTP